MSIFQTSKALKITPYPKFIVRRVSDLAICRRLKKRSLLEVNEHFQTSKALKMTPYHKFIVRRMSDLAICRRLKKRSLLEVNEHFSDKQSAEDDSLSQ